MTAIYNLLGIIIVSSIILTAFPMVDLYISELFFDRSTMSFPYLEHPITLFFYYFIHVISVTIIATCLASLYLHCVKYKSSIIAKLQHYNKKLFNSPRCTLFIFITLLVAPGAMVHWGFKETFQRARPIEIKQFGGNKTFTPSYKRAYQDSKSFISGHAAMGFFMVAFSLLFHGKLRNQLYISGLVFGIIAASCRIIQGKHYLSDALLGGLFTLLVIHIAYQLFFTTISSKKQHSTQVYE